MGDAVRVTIDVAAEVHKYVAKLADEDDRSVSSMFLRLVKAGLVFDGDAKEAMRAKAALSAPQTTNTTFNPIKSETEDKPKAPKVDPKKMLNGHPRSVVMDNVEVFITGSYCNETIVCDNIKVSFAQSGAVTTLGQLVDRKTGEVVDSVRLGPDQMADTYDIRLKVSGTEALRQRWQAGDYRITDDHGYAPVLVEDGRIYNKPQPIPQMSVRYEPSAEQLAMYRDRGWDSVAIEKFIELRSKMVTGGPGHFQRESQLFTDIDMFMAEREQAKAGALDDWG